MSQNISLSRNSDNALANGSTQNAETYAAKQTGYISDPSQARLNAAGAPNGATNAYDNQRGQTLSTTVNSSSGGIRSEDDWRIRISLQPSLAKYFYNSDDNILLSPLRSTNGVIFPYTPQIQVTHQARYNPQILTHSNYASYFYEGSEVQQISIQGEFTVQNVAEGQYLMAAIHFFRSVTKMFFNKDIYAGAPPPIVFLNGYGSLYFPNVSTVVTTFSHTMPSDADYIEVPLDQSLNNYSGNSINLRRSNIVRLPTTSSISVSLQPIYSRNNISNNFNLQTFAKGQLNNKTTSGAITGGFI
jgi:hypothetical protein